MRRKMSYSSLVAAMVIAIMATTSCGKAEKKDNSAVARVSWTPEKKRQAREECKSKFAASRDNKYKSCLDRIPMDGDWDTLGQKAE